MGIYSTARMYLAIQHNWKFAQVTTPIKGDISKIELLPMMAPEIGLTIYDFGAAKRGLQSYPLRRYGPA